MIALADAIDDYLASKYLVEPLRRADLTMISDGGAAIVVTSADRAGDLAKPPVYVLGMAEQTALRGDQNPRITPEMLAQERRDMIDWEYKQEWEC